MEKILKDTHTRARPLRLCAVDGPEWVAGLRQVRRSQWSRHDTRDTIPHRVNLKGVCVDGDPASGRSGKLSLEDPVHKLAPEVWFENRWEATDPVRVVHLLEHTTGWTTCTSENMPRMRRPDMGLREALDYDHHSRVSRWRPGTRMAYCNSGPAVAAHIVEKLTNQRFEDFVEQNLFRPIGMKTATYWPPPAGAATTLYHSDGKTPYPYWNILSSPVRARSTLPLETWRLMSSSISIAAW